MIDQSGQLDRRITIQSFTESTDDFGEVILSFTTLANVWAKVVEKAAMKVRTGTKWLPRKKSNFSFVTARTLTSKCKLYTKTKPTQSKRF